MVDRKRRTWVAAAAAPLVAIGLLAAGTISASAATTVTTVTGSAFGYETVGITLFGGVQNPAGPKPTESLQSNASNSPQSGSTTTGLVQYGPATIFSSDAITVQSTGSTGTSGSVTTSTAVKNINKAATQTSTGNEAMTVDNLTSTCTASGSGASGSTTVTNGSLVTDNGPTPPTTVTIPTNPAPNTTIPGVLRVNGSTDSWHYVFNEQTMSGGTLTVNAVDEYFQGPTLKGNLIIGQSVCGVTTATVVGTTSSSGHSSVSSSGVSTHTGSSTVRTSSSVATTTSGATTSATTSATTASSTTSSAESSGAVSALSGSSSSTSSSSSVTAPKTGAGGIGIVPSALLALLGAGLVTGAVLVRRRGRRRGV